MSTRRTTSPEPATPSVDEPTRPPSVLTRLRALYVELTLRAGSLILVGYAVAGGLIGIEIFAFVAVWPLGIALLIVFLITGKLAWRRTTQPRAQQ